MGEFYIKPRIWTGAGSLSILSSLNADSVLVVTDPFWQESGGIQKVTEQLHGRTVVFSDVRGEPTGETVAKGTAEFEALNPAAVVAMGGGSVLDCAKAIRHFARTERDAVPLWAIPTTAGTGSEVTAYAVITTNGEKCPMVSEDLIPDAAILDGSLLHTLPNTVLADSALDALSHGVEAYVAQGGTGMSDGLAEVAVIGIFHNLEAACKGERDRCGALLEASCMAGMAFQSAGLGLCHGLSHAIGGRFHLPHGRINAVLLPTVVRAQMEAAGERSALAEKYAKLGRRAGVTEGRGRSGAMGLVRGIERLRLRLGMPRTLTEAGLERAAVTEALPELVHAALQDPCTAGGPVTATVRLATDILREVL